MNTDGAPNWDDLIGPFYTVAGVAEWWGVETLEAWWAVIRGDILALMLGDRSVVIPSFQFGPAGDTADPGLSDIMEAYGPSWDRRWSLALWLNTELRSLGGRTPMKALFDGQFEDVLALAKDQGYRLSH